MTRFACSREIVLEPLLYAIENNLIEHPFQMHISDEAHILDDLKNGRLDMGMLTPLEYAQNTGELKIIREFAVFSPFSGKNALLFFKGNLTSIDKVYFTDNPSSSYMQFFGEMILNEMFKIHAEWVPVEKVVPPDEMLEKYPVLFLGGKEAIDYFGLYDNYLDLSEEWCLKNSLPMVYRLIAVREDYVDDGEIAALNLSRELGIRNIGKIAKSFAEEKEQNWNIYFDLLNDSYQYFPTAEVWESLQEILQFIFFYGKSEYLPEIKFY